MKTPPRSADRPAKRPGKPFVCGDTDLPTDAELAEVNAGLDEVVALGRKETARRAFGLAYPYAMPRIGFMSRDALPFNWPTPAGFAVRKATLPEGAGGHLAPTAKR